MLPVKIPSHRVITRAEYEALPGEERDLGSSQAEKVLDGKVTGRRYLDNHRGGGPAWYYDEGDRWAPR